MKQIARNVTAEVLTPRGPVTCYVLFFIHLESRRVDIAVCADAMRRTKARRIVPALSFVQTLRSKEVTKWTGHRAQRFLGRLFTARWN
jgi:hypothetical protein